MSIKLHTDFTVSPVGDIQNPAWRPSIIADICDGKTVETIEITTAVNYMDKQYALKKTRELFNRLKRNL